jgi:6-pyruvoyltetrahydropterin/6-carboxytetrahydropterin synthase
VLLSIPFSARRDDFVAGQLANPRPIVNRRAVGPCLCFLPFATLRNYRGKRENVHGHNYLCQVTVGGGEPDEIGLLADFVELRRMAPSVVDRLDHQWLNEYPPFDRLNPSAGNIAKHIYDEAYSGLKTQGRCAAGAGAALGDGYGLRGVSAGNGIIRARGHGRDHHEVDDVRGVRAIAGRSLPAS